MPGLDEARDRLGRHVLDEGLPLLDGLDAPRVEIDADHGRAGFGERDRQRQADVAEPHHAHGRAGRDPLPERLRRRRHSRAHTSRTVAATVSTSPSESSAKHGSDSTSRTARRASGQRPSPPPNTG